MADVLIFDPSEFEVLETFDFEEEIQKSEETRFFTLDSQLTDYFEKTLPKGKVTKHEIKELKQFKDRLKIAYEGLIVATDSDYIINTARKSINIPWVNPVYSSFDYKQYSYDKEWRPIFANRPSVNYYPRMIGALPRPFTSTEDGRMLSSKATLLNAEGLKPVTALGNYLSTKTIIKDDGTYDTITVEIPNTADEIKTLGFYLGERPELPRPLLDHPFLKSNQPTFVKTDVSLLDSFPSVTAIMEHVIPTSTNPYESSKLLKLYDVKLSQIPWVAWKERFPPVERQDVAMPILELKFRRDSPDAPSEVLTKVYSDWNPGYDSRLWLSQQVDGGYFVSKLLLSESASAGSLAVSPFSEVPTASFPESKPEICMMLTSSFDSFLSSGIYRPVKGSSGQCIPVSTIMQEKVIDAYKGRTAWKESTKHDLLVEYQKLLKQFQVPIIAEAIKYQKFEHLVQSERRRDALVIQEDPNRESEDKAEALEKIVRDLTLENRLYYDVPGQFVLCLHTIEVLRGALEDKFKFYAEWTVSIDGKRTCRFCGEEINADTYNAVKEYDEDGHLVMEYSALETEMISTDNFVNSLAELKKLFNADNAGESLLFTILTFLQVLPDEKQLMPVLQLIRKLSAGLKARAAASKSIAKEKQELVEGSLGIAGAVVLLQAHNPFLIPKRNIGNRPLSTAGYPRDSDDPEDCQLLNALLVLLRKTFESFPGSYRGNVATILREVLKKSKTLQEQSLQWIKFFAEQNKPLFESARERYEAPEAEAPKNTLVLPIESVDNPVYQPGEALEEEKPMHCKISRVSTTWSTKRLPNVTQSEVRLQSKIEPSPYSVFVEPVDSTVPSESVPDVAIRKRVSLGLPPGFPLLADFIKTADGAAFVTVTSRLLAFLSKTSMSVKEQKELQKHIVRIDIAESNSLIRDIAKGFFFELMHTVKASAPLTRAVNDALKNDLTLRMILLSKDAAEKEDFELRAKERNTLKAAFRSMNDAERELTQRLLELGLSEFLITNVDRERFVRELNYKEPDETVPVDVNRPEEGYSDERDYVENGDQPIAEDGTILQVDYGDYGDRAVRDYNDYTSQYDFDEDTL
uniref:Uncharacterized protein n=1 Tax=viral metagenome TaxID=1070528 RepID=A0A6C0B3N2_9ZZZZ